MAEAGKQEYGFELVGGRLCLDFVNTLNGSRETGQTEEKLLTYADLVSWAKQTGIVTEQEARALLKEAARRPKMAAKVVSQAVALREAVYGIFYSTAHERPPAKDDMSTLNAALSEAMMHSEVVRTPEGFHWRLSSEDDTALARVLWHVARSAAELLTSDEIGRARV
jgi:predicted RNA-binding Zn ribbon-like protein